MRPAAVRASGLAADHGRPGRATGRDRLRGRNLSRRLLGLAVALHEAGTDLLDGRAGLVELLVMGKGPVSGFAGSGDAVVGPRGAAAAR